MVPGEESGYAPFMQSSQSLLPLITLAAAGLAVVPGAASAQERPDFTGVWVFNEERSDDLQAKVVEAAGPDTTSGDIKDNQVRLWIRKWLLGVLEDPDSRYLTVEQSERDFKTGLGDDVSIFYFGREAASQGPLGGTLRVSVAWEGTQLRLTEKADDGGQITAVYTLLPPGDTLLVTYLLDHKRLIKPLEAAMFFDRDTGAE